MAKVLVLCGGDNPERLVSLSSGDAVAMGLIKAGHVTSKLDTSNPGVVVKGNIPLLDGVVGPAPPEELANARLTRAGWSTLVNTLTTNNFDVVFPILHGSGGEDGRI